MDYISVRDGVSRGPQPAVEEESPVVEKKSAAKAKKAAEKKVSRQHPVRCAGL